MKYLLIFTLFFSFSIFGQEEKKKEAVTTLSAQDWDRYKEYLTRVANIKQSLAHAEEMANLYAEMISVKYRLKDGDKINSKGEVVRAVSVKTEKK